MHRQSSRSRRLLGLLLMVFATMLGSNAGAKQSGEIALIEDSDGSINANALTQVHQMKAACAFYKTFDDRYDVLFIFTTRKLSFVNNDPQGFPVNSPSKGIGRGESSATRSFCSSTGRLRHAVKMGTLAYYSTNADALYKGLPGYTLSAVELMGHEFGHHWLANVEYDLNDSAGRQCLLRAYIPQSALPDPTAPRCSGKPEGDFNQHWSVRFNQNSVMYSNSIEDLGGGSFRVYRETLKYGPFDQYLMGLIAAKDVPPSYVVSTEYPSDTEGFPMGAGQEKKISGTRINVSIEDIIRRMGPRDPVLESCHWKAAFILVYDPGQPPSANQIAIVEAQRQRWESWYASATDGRGSFDTTLRGCGTGTATCPGLPHPSCSEPDCDEGALRCASEKQAEICSAHTWRAGDACTGNTSCRDGLCRSDAPDGDLESESGGEEDESEGFVADGEPEAVADGDSEATEKDSEVRIDGDSDADTTDHEHATAAPSSGSGGGCQSPAGGTGLLLVLGLLGLLLLRWRRAESIARLAARDGSRTDRQPPAH